MAVVRLILRLSSLGVALLRLVVGPCLNAHKRHVRDPLYSFNGLLGLRDPGSSQSWVFVGNVVLYRLQPKIEGRMARIPPAISASATSAPMPWGRIDFASCGLRRMTDTGI